MSGFTLIDDRDPTTGEALWWLGERGDMTLKNYMFEGSMMWKIHFIFHTEYKTHEVKGSGITAQDCAVEVMRWAEEIIKADEENIGQDTSSGDGG